MAFLVITIQNLLIFGVARLSLLRGFPSNNLPILNIPIMEELIYDKPSLTVSIPEPVNKIDLLGAEGAISPIID
jgi:hypothetical protein